MEITRSKSEVPFSEFEGCIEWLTVHASSAIYPRDSFSCLHGCWYRRAAGHRSPHIVPAKVAGYDHAAFAAPEGALARLLAVDGMRLVEGYRPKSLMRTTALIHAADYG